MLMGDFDVGKLMTKARKLFDQNQSVWVNGDFASLASVSKWLDKMHELLGDHHKRHPVCLQVKLPDCCWLGDQL